MCHAIEIYRIRVSKGRYAIVILILTCCCLSCYDPADPSCLREKGSLTATVSEGGMPSYLFSAGPCDIGFGMYINSIGGDSIVISGIASVVPGGTGTLSISIGFNIISEGEYTIGVNSIPGEPFAECNYAFVRNLIAYRVATTNPDGSGTVIIDSLSSDYISGTFQVTCISNYTGIPSDSDTVKITAGSFSGPLVSGTY